MPFVARLVLCSSAVCILSAPGLQAQVNRDSTYKDPPKLARYDGSFQYAAAFPGLFVDTAKAHKWDAVHVVFASGTVPIWIAPDSAARVVRRIARGEAFILGRSYPSGWARAWGHLPSGKARMLGWARGDDPRLKSTYRKPSYTRTQHGTVGDWLWSHGPDPISDGPRAQAAVPARDVTPPFDTDFDPYLTFACRDNGARVVMVRDPSALFSVQGRVRVLLRVDKEVPITVRSSVNMSGDGALLPSDVFDDLTWEIRAGQQLHVRVFDEAGTPHTYSFSLRGATSAIRRVYCFVGTGFFPPS